MTSATQDAGLAQAPPPDQDPLAVLIAQHGRIRRLFDEVEAAGGEARLDALRALVRLLAVHWTAEEEVIRPRTRAATEGGGAIAEDRLREGRQAKAALRGRALTGAAC